MTKLQTRKQVSEMRKNASNLIRESKLVDKQINQLQRKSRQLKKRALGWYGKALKKEIRCMETI